jgi:hypothetical protein
MTRPEQLASFLCVLCPFAPLRDMLLVAPCTANGQFIHESHKAEVHKKKMLKMKVDPTMFLKAKGRKT